MIEEETLQISGIVHKHGKYRYLIDFGENKKIHVPTYYVHNEKIEFDKKQKLYIETWFLMKKGIIPKNYGL